MKIKEEILKIVKNMLEENLKKNMLDEDLETKKYFGVYGQVRINQFIAELKHKL